MNDELARKLLIEQVHRELLKYEAGTYDGRLIVITEKISGTGHVFVIPDEIYTELWGERQCKK